MFTSERDLRRQSVKNPSFTDLMSGMLNFMRYPGYPYVTSWGNPRSGSGTGNPGGGSGNNGGGGTTNPPPGGRPPYQWTPPQLMQAPAMPYSLGPDWRSTMMMNVPFPPYPNNQ